MHGAGTRALGKSERVRVSKPYSITDGFTESVNKPNGISDAIADGVAQSKSITNAKSHGAGGMAGARQHGHPSGNRAHELRRAVHDHRAEHSYRRQER